MLYMSQNMFLEIEIYVQICMKLKSQWWSISKKNRKVDLKIQTIKYIKTTKQ